MASEKAGQGNASGKESDAAESPPATAPALSTATTASSSNTGSPPAASADSATTLAPIGGHGTRVCAGLKTDPSSRINLVAPGSKIILTEKSSEKESSGNE
jgi:hypothetical protein